jgi:hypothetical protein
MSRDHACRPHWELREIPKTRFSRPSESILLVSTKASGFDLR